MVRFCDLHLCSLGVVNSRWWWRAYTPVLFLGAGESSFGSRGSEAVVSGVGMQWLSTSVKWDFTQIWEVCMR